MKRIALRLSLAQAASGTVGGAYTPFFGAWLAWRGLTPPEIGVVIAVGLLLRVVVAPVTGMIADARNDRRTMMLVLYGVMAAGYAALTFSTSHVVIAAGAVAGAVAGGAVSPLLESVTIRLSERFAFDYGRVRLWCSSVFVACNFLSGRAVTRFGMMVIAPWLAIGAALTFFTIAGLPAAPPDHPRGDFTLKLRATIAEARELLMRPAFLLFLATSSLDQASHALYYAYGGLHWRQLGYSGTLIGEIWPIGIFAEILLMSISLHVFRVLGSTKLLILGALGCVLRWSLLAFDPPLPLVLFAQLLHGATFAMAHLGAMYFILKAVPPRLAATAQSLYAVCASGLVMGIATLASGPLYAAYGGRAYLLMAAMGAASLVFGLLLAATWDGERVAHHGPEEALDVI